MYAFLAFLPILVAIVLMVSFNWPAKKALPVSWLLTVIVGLFACYTVASLLDLTPWE